MKFLFSILWLSFASFSQDSLVTGTKEFWASGACCSSGTNYILKIDQKAIVDLLNSGYCLDSLFCDGKLFFGKAIDISPEKSTFVVKFNIYHDERNFDSFFINENVILNPKKDQIVLTKGSEVEVFWIGKLEELPCIPYP